MTKRTIFSSDNSLSDLQLKFNPKTGELEKADVRIDEVFGYDYKMEIMSDKVYLNENDVFCYVKPTCPLCGGRHVKKYGTRSSNKFNDHGLKFDYKVQLYYCSKCNYKFTTNVDGLIDKHSRYINEIKNKISDNYKQGYDSLRRMAKKFEINLGIKISHQTVRNWYKENLQKENIIIDSEKHLIKNNMPDLSGYLVYDEEYLKISGKKHYRLLLFDHINYAPIAEQITDNLKSETIKGFIQECSENQNFISITTDAYQSYFKIMKKFGVKHQLCHFHFMKNINDIINNYNFQKRMSEKKYNYLIEQTQRLKNIFNKETVDEINKEIKYFKRIYDYLPRPINKYIQGHLVKRLDHYLHYRENENIPKTSNNAENYFQTCDSNCMKKVYRTPEGAELFISHKMIYWNENFRKI